MESGRDGARDAVLDELLELLESDRVRDVLHSANEPYVFKHDFISGIDLAGADGNTLWELLRLARRATGHDLMKGGGFRPDVWFTPTPKILRALHSIDVLCAGQLDTLLSRLHGEHKRFFVHALMDEAAAPSMSPQQQAAPQDPRHFLRRGARPRTWTERLVYNTYKTMQRVPQIAESPISIDTLYLLQESLGDDLTHDAKEPTRLRQRNVPLRGSVDSWHESSKAPPVRDIRKEMENIADYLEYDSDPFVHPVIRGILAYFWLEDMRPFDLSEIGLSRALFQTYMYRAGYPAMILLPISHVLLHRSADFERAWGAKRLRRNLTDFVLFALQNVDDALRQLADSIDSHVADYERLQQELSFDPSLNYRQRSIIGRALRLPDAVFSIAYHQHSYSIAYSTARADLMKLVDRGYLAVRRRGRAFVFAPARDLRELVHRRSTVAAR